MLKITLSKDQEIAYKTISKWLADGGIVHQKQKNPKLLSLGGYAGSGKTTLVSNIAKEFGTAIGFAFALYQEGLQVFLAESFKTKVFSLLMVDITVVQFTD